MSEYQVKVTRPTDNITINVGAGEILFVLGANGSGKSGLMQAVYAHNKGHARRVAAHRQTWFQSDALELSPQQKISIEQQIENHDTQASARWKDQQAQQRPNIALYELLNSQNLRARKIADAYDKGDFETADRASKKDAPLNVINRMFQLSNIPIQISLQGQDRVRATKHQRDEYSVAELSDGERNALLVACNILTAPENSLILLDEPERHLHRSIISPFIKNLAIERPDCAFVVSTHEVSLPIDSHPCKTLLLRECEFENGRPARWDCDLLEEDAEIDDTIKLDIFGARRKLLFVEGVSGSLDKALYSVLFPGVSVIPKENCKNVETTVRGIRSAPDVHWVEAYGIVDRDARTGEDVSALERDGVIALKMYSVEGLYYAPKIVELIAERFCEVDGGDPNERFKRAIDEALSAVEPHLERMAERRAEKRVREEYLKQIPNAKTVQDKLNVNITIDVTAVVNEEQQRAKEAHQNQDFGALVRMYPIRETPALDRLVKSLGFQSRLQYEDGVLKLVAENEEARKALYDMVSPLREKLFPNDN